MLSERLKSGMKQVELAAKGLSEYVPVTAQVTSHTLRLTGVNERDFFSDPALFVSSHLLVSEYYEFDSPAIYYDMYNIEAEALGQKLTWLPRMFPEIDSSAPLIHERSVLDRLKPIDPASDGRMPFIREVNKRMMDIGLKPSPRFCAPFS